MGSAIFFIVCGLGGTRLAARQIVSGLAIPSNRAAMLTPSPIRSVSLLDDLSVVPVASQHSARCLALDRLHKQRIPR